MKQTKEQLDHEQKKPPVTPPPLPPLTPAEVTDCFQWLDDLRESGRVNMLGAYPLLAEAFLLDRDVAKRVWVAWAESFGQRAELTCDEGE